MEEVKFFDGSNNRIGVKVNCPICQKEFVTRKDLLHKNKCCSKKCQGKNRTFNNTTEVNCSWCNKSYRRKNSKFGINKTTYTFCTRQCKDLAQKLGGIEDIMPDHYGTGNRAVGISDYKRYNLDITKCTSCVENRYYLLCVHHIDGNRKNNNTSNLEVVCYNCHAKRHLTTKNGRLVVNFNYLTDKDKLKEL